MDNRAEVIVAGGVETPTLGNDEICEVQYDYEPNGTTCVVQREMGIHRRTIRSVHGRDFLGKSTLTPMSVPSTSSMFFSCLEISDESVIDTILEGCPDVDNINKILKEQKLSLTKKRCIKSKLTPVNQSSLLQLSFCKKLKYQMSISFGKLKVGFRYFLYTFELWYSSLKVIEGKFGSSIATYFKFLRKLFILNCIIFFLNFFFIILPQLLCDQFPNCDIPNYENITVEETIATSNSNQMANVDTTDSSEEFFFFKTYGDDHTNSLRLGNIFTGKGPLSDSVLFYGHYRNSSFSLNSSYAYDIPSGYFFSIAFCFFLVLCVLFFSVAESYKKCFIETSNGVKNVFAEKIFCGWDFGITKSKAEKLKYSTICMELKELLNESKNNKKVKTLFDSFHTVIIRISLNMILLLLLIALGWYASLYLNRHMDSADTPTVMMLMLILTLISSLAPVIFSWLAKVEYYSGPRSALYATLIRTFVLHVLIVAMIVAHRLNSSSKITCWETVVGQDIYRLIILDFIVGVGDGMVQFIRSRMNRRWKKIERPEFNIARNTMNLIYNQGLLYVGLYFSPGLSLLVAFKMFLTFYFKKWEAMYNCRPSKRPWRAAQTQTVFLSFAFLVFFFVVIAYGYIFTSVKTSVCGPFAGRKYVMEVVLYEILNAGVNYTALKLISQFFRPGVVVIILLVMILAIYYLRSVNLVRRSIVKNLRHIIRDQAASKKKLLMKIRKAQEDYKAISELNENRRRNHSSFQNASMVPHEESDASDPDGFAEDVPLRWGSINFDLAEKNQMFGVRDRLCKSSLNLVSADDARKQRMTYKSIQDLSLFCSTDLNSISENFLKLNTSNPIIGEEAAVEKLSKPLKEDKLYSNRDKSCTKIEKQCKEDTHYSKVYRDCDKESDREKENCELMPIFVRKESPPHYRKSYNYDERVPSRIYFDRRKKGKR